ncbi:MAG: O-antigen ligase family protein [Tannerellaceae bacterium]|nr:O-antigen ligase family protein [Tannerellaceae bacterium]
MERHGKEQTKRFSFPSGMTMGALGGLLILAAVFAVEPSLKNGLVMGPVFWFHRATFILAIIVLLCEFFSKTVARSTSASALCRNRIHIMLPDMLLLAFGGITLLTYRWALHPEPEKLLFGGQLLLLWFILRVLLGRYPSLRNVFLVFILLTGLIQAVWGLEQLYGYRASHHSFFRLTGSFFNPGPYSGYLAVILPVALHFILRTGNFRKYPWRHYTVVLRYASLAVFISMLLVLPAGMSRSAWLAAGVSCAWVYWMQRAGWEKVKEIIHTYRRWMVPVSVLVAGCLFAGVMGLFLLKKDSANGRLLMWKITARAITHQPVSGTGLGGFPAAFAGEQASYFTSGSASATEKLVAGSPEYAFNEYLQTGLEQGIIGIVCFLLWLSCCFYAGVRNRRIGAAGGIVAFAVFAASSYPLQLPAFGVLLIFLSAICVAGPCFFSFKKAFSFKANPFFIALLAALLSGACCLLQQKRYQAYKGWTVFADYEALYPLLNHKPEYLFDYAQSLHKAARYEEACQLLKRAVRLSADPMLWYMLGKNAQASGHYEEAEMYLLHGVNILPERIYPHYLLAKLYLEMGQEEKAEAEIHTVLTKPPKVESKAVDEMRIELIKLRVER